VNPDPLSYNQNLMRSRRVTLAVMLYIALDFATPGMPGAVQFVGGSPDTVEGAQTLRWKVTAPAVADRRRVQVVPQQEAVSQLARRTVAPASFAVVSRHCAPEVGRTALPSSDDH